MKKYYVVMDNGEYNHYSKEYATREEAEAVARAVREAFGDAFETIEVEAE